MNASAEQAVPQLNGNPGPPPPPGKGYVVGPDSATDAHLAIFDGDSGAVIRDGGAVPTGGGGSFLSANTARVDPSGDDGTGTVGDLNKPFLTVQAAINAIELLGDLNDYYVIEFPVLGDYTEDLRTALTFLAFKGMGEAITTPTFFNSLAFTDNGRVVFYVSNGKCNSITKNVGELDIYADNVSFNGTIQNPGASTTITLYGGSNPLNEFNVSLTSESIYYIGCINPYQGPTTTLAVAVNAYFSLLGDITAAGYIGLTDSRIMGTNSSGTTPSYSDILLNPALMNFSTLPTSEPTEVGKAWIDTTGGFNIVKVKL